MRVRGQKIVFTAEQLAWTRANAAAMTRDEMSAHLGCAVRTLGKLLKKLSLTGLRKRPWGDRDTALLRAMASTHPITSIVRTMRRDWMTVVPKAAELGISLDFDHWWPKEKVERLRRLAATGLTRREIAAEMGERYQTLNRNASRLGIAIRSAYGNPHRAPLQPRRASRPAKKQPKPATLPRERVGLPVAIRRNVISGKVAWCPRCHAAVVDTPKSWADHDQRVHVQPIFAVPCSTRRIA